MRRYFEAEMRMLRDAGEAYAEAHPEQARQLGLDNIHDRDPYVERLLEGFAFLSAQVRQRIDAAAATTANDLLEASAPDLVRPYPAATVVAFAPTRRQRGSRHVPAGTALRSEPMGQERVRLEMRTTRQLTVTPLELVSLDAGETPWDTTRFRLEFRWHGEEAWNTALAEGVPVFLDADRPLALALYRLFGNGLSNAAMELPDGSRQLLPELRFSPDGFDRDQAVNAALPTARPGLRLLQDYFAFRARYLFLRLQGLAEPDEAGTAPQRFYLTFETQRGLPRDHRLSARNLALHAVPAVNLFPCEARPVHVDGREQESEIRAEADRVGTVRVHSVRSAHARGRKSARLRELRSLESMVGPDQSGAWYATECRDVTGDWPTVWLRTGGLPLDEAHTVSLALNATHGNLPRRYLREERLEASGRELPAGLVARSLFRPSPSRQPADPIRRANVLLALLRADLESLLDRDALVSCLNAVEWTAAPENRSRIKALESVTARPFQRMEAGVLVSGIEVQLELREESGFSSLDDVYLFGEVLHQFFRDRAPMNQALVTRLVCQPSGRSFQWPRGTLC